MTDQPTVPPTTAPPTPPPNPAFRTTVSVDGAAPTVEQQLVRTAPPSQPVVVPSAPASEESAKAGSSVEEDEFPVLLERGDQRSSASDPEDLVRMRWDGWRPARKNGGQA